MEFWTLKQFRSTVDVFMAAKCDDAARKSVRFDLAILREKGREAGTQLSKAVGDGIFEFRSRSGTLRIRMLYYFLPGRVIVFVHAFIKKGGPVPEADKKLAKKRRALIHQGEGLHDFKIDTTTVRH